MKPILSRPAKTRALLFLGLLLMAIGILGGTIWRNFHHFESVLSYVDYSHRIQKISVGLHQSIIGYLIENRSDWQPMVLAKTLEEMEELMADKRYLSDATKNHLAELRTMLKDVAELGQLEKTGRLSQALKIMDETLEYEALQREKSLEDINFTTQNELYIALAMFTLILLGAISFLHSRILHPLNDLSKLLERLTEENFTPITTDHLDPLLLPVFSSYNVMVIHLAELEEAKRLYAQSLQREVRLATQALLEQQHSLARAERLAAIGEVAAELAHEIRNPLAGILMAFNNLRREIDNPQQCERMELINSELKRLAVLLTDMLNQSKHTPETASHFDLAALIRDLAALTRYQIPEIIQLEIDTPEQLHVYLPESGMRQMLLNLLLNAADALEHQPGLIRIEVYAGSRGKGLGIDVLDNGPGFNQDMLDYGIRPFRTSRQRGTGLGLAMVQRFVKNLGGIIKLNNQQPHGACVTVLLPEVCLLGERHD
ncbi:MAG: HAMP domain-containing sensor histidine kinase [Methylovulum sp.]|uniref:sensor histidine kinase n=1 Tax=Methylovulum sp. TaxID=1916980 RepID=UPI002634CF05|nr:HAMP domain-containing sensor histidine kinase [Methylovulum sp.]MDD2725154.1 HAMP domain-containing sensor histidine kinase [Methylovulum sp.]MDD5126288.1 HAMP domain-containing sensor histidine kinase [Methylovulum sp.]